jgi:hypothetical protein
VALSSLSLLKVLPDMRRFDVLGAWWIAPEGAAVASRLSSCRAAGVGIVFFFSFSFVILGVGCVAAQRACCSGWLLY